MNSSAQVIISDTQARKQKPAVAVKKEAVSRQTAITAPNKENTDAAKPTAAQTSGIALDLGRESNNGDPKDADFEQY